MKQIWTYQPRNCVKSNEPTFFGQYLTAREIEPKSFD
jgi:hypothetical protein